MHCAAPSTTSGPSGADGEMHARELAVAQHDALAAQQAAAKAEARAARAEQGEEAERSRADTINALLEATQEELAGQRALTDAARQDAQAVQEAPRRSGRPRPPGRRGAAYAAPGTVGGGDSVAGGRRSPAGGPASRVAAESRAARPLGTAPGGMAGTVGVVNRCRPDRREPDQLTALFQRLRCEGPRAAKEARGTGRRLRAASRGE